MIFTNFFITNIFVCIYLFYFIKEYYNPYRFIKGFINFFLEMGVKNILFALYFLFSILNLFYSFFLFELLIYLLLLMLIIMLPKIKFRLHKRGIRLLFMCFFFSIFIFFLDYRISNFLLFVSPIFIIIISNVLLYPYEELIRKKYIKKAKNKLKKINPIIIGITGSFGKTTFKNYLYHVLKNKYHVCASNGNVNTLMGLTKYINNSVISTCEVLILEIGIDKYKGIRKFKKLFDLDIGVITSVGKMHLSTFKTYKRLVDSKCEMDLLVKEKGGLFINGNYDELKNKNYIHNVNFYNDNNVTSDVNKYQSSAISGVIEIARYLNVDEKAIISSLKKLPQVERRFEIKKSENMIVINDSYNSNFYGVKECLNFMNKYTYKKIVISGGLIEQGKEFYKENYKLGLLMKDIDYLFLISKKKKHPLIKGFKKVSNGKVYVLKDVEFAKKEIIKINDKKIILISAKGDDFFSL